MIMKQSSHMITYSYQRYMYVLTERGQLDTATLNRLNVISSMLSKGYKPKTVHSVRERTDRGP